MLTTVTSHAIALPASQGISVLPSGRLPSSLTRPDGSLIDGTLALHRARHYYYYYYYFFFIIIIIIIIISSSSSSSSRVVMKADGSKHSAIECRHLVDMF